jgi:hypothetical protein
MHDDLGLGDRVYYTDNGPDDVGTVGNIDHDGVTRKYGVIWDDLSSSDVYLRSQLTAV